MTNAKRKRLEQEAQEKQERLQRERAALTTKALELLRSPELLPIYLDDVRKAGLVGEERNALVVFITGVSRLLARPMNLIVKGQSSAGKNFLVSTCLKLFPSDSIRELTSSSATAWNYAGDDFVHRIVYLQERNEASGAVHPARLLISEGKLVRTVTGYQNGVRKAIRYETKGPIASISTTTRDRLTIDDETRNTSIWIDESEQQTRRVAVATAKNSTPISSRRVRVWHEVQRILQSRVGATIGLPAWFGTVAEQVYVGDVRVRRYFPAFKSACEAIALLSSFQIDREAEYKRRKVIEITFEDYATAAFIFEEVFADSLHRANDETLGTRAAIQRIAERQRGKGVSAQQLARELSISRDKAYERLRKALDAGVVVRSNKPQKGNLKLFLPGKMPRFLPHPEDVFRNIREVGNSFDLVHPLTGERIHGVR